MAITHALRFARHFDRDFAAEAFACVLVGHFTLLEFVPDRSPSLQI
jgi:hypothetical protein